MKQGLKVAIRSRIPNLIEACHYEIARIPHLHTMTEDCSLIITDQLDASCKVLLSEPGIAVQLLHLHEASGIEWLQSSFAGVNVLVDSCSRRDFICTRVGTGFGPQMAEYCFGWMLHFSLSMSLLSQHQAEKIWRPEPFQLRQSLNGKVVGILGVGDIGHHLATTASSFGMTSIGLGRTERSDSSASYHPFQKVSNDIDEVLSSCDYLINCLPSTKETRSLLSLEKFSLCASRCPIFINVGRGDITTMSTVAAALAAEYISHAVLDVFETEPLDTEDPIWANPKVSITPHISANSTAQLVSKLFVQNLSKFVLGERLDFIVDFSRGY